MDKKTKKRIDVLRQRLQRLQQQASGIRKQTDDANELCEIERQVEVARKELESLLAVAK